ncbi:hypothetical protein [Cytobacillus sp. IB215316]|uniref:hypothetical protein n=1 Tax=Cytobacillus sp. IB215316 TaxID=3097354 RepID=UPI002A0C34C9|nr:hypothetical protein [Cytobacillus sp. IB215316]MDX8361632.1 hypothetical protein [Cytobacillus sp. IB215316]
MLRYKFTGEQIRLLYPDLNTEINLTIKIDDQSYTISESGIGGFLPTVFFEKLDLEDKEHIVEVSGEKIYLDAIDIEKGAELLPYVEDGWKRYDDQNQNIQSDGLMRVTDTIYKFNNTATKSGPKNGFDKKIKFNFTGTKIRLIESFQAFYAINSTIKIDDQIYNFPQYDISDPKRYNPVFFEKLGLENKEHTVEITVSDRDDYFFVLDAIDIDADGELLPYNENVFSLIATPDDSEVVLTWDEIPDASFYVLRSTTPGGPYTTLTKGYSGTTFTDTGVEDGVTYYYVVNGSTYDSVNDEFEYYNSNEASVILEATPLE